MGPGVRVQGRAACCLKGAQCTVLLEAGWPVASASDHLLLVRDQGSKVLGSLAEGRGQGAGQPFSERYL